MHGHNHTTQGIHNSINNYTHTNIDTGKSINDINSHLHNINHNDRCNSGTQKSPNNYRCRNTKPHNNSNIDNMTNNPETNHINKDISFNDTRHRPNKSQLPHHHRFKQHHRLHITQYSSQCQAQHQHQSPYPPHINQQHHRHHNNSSPQTRLSPKPPQSLSSNPTDLLQPVTDQHTLIQATIRPARSLQHQHQSSPHHSQKPQHPQSAGHPPFYPTNAPISTQSLSSSNQSDQTSASQKRAADATASAVYHSLHFHDIAHSDNKISMLDQEPIPPFILDLFVPGAELDHILPGISSYPTHIYDYRLREVKNSFSERYPEVDLGLETTFRFPSNSSSSDTDEHLNTKNVNIDGSSLSDDDDTNLNQIDNVKTLVTNPPINTPSAHYPTGPHTVHNTTTLEQLTTVRSTVPFPAEYHFLPELSPNLVVFLNHWWRRIVDSMCNPAIICRIKAKSTQKQRYLRGTGSNGTQGVTSPWVHSRSGFMVKSDAVFENSLPMNKRANNAHLFYTFRNFKNSGTIPPLPNTILQMITSDPVQLLYCNFIPPQVVFLWDKHGIIEISRYLFLVLNSANIVMTSQYDQIIPWSPNNLKLQPHLKHIPINDTHPHFFNTRHNHPQTIPIMPPRFNIKASLDVYSVDFLLGQPGNIIDLPSYLLKYHPEHTQVVITNPNNTSESVIYSPPFWFIHFLEKFYHYLLIFFHSSILNCLKVPILPTTTPMSTTTSPPSNHNSPVTTGNSHSDNHSPPHTLSMSSNIPPPSKLSSSFHQMMMTSMSVKPKKFLAIRQFLTHSSISSHEIDLCCCRILNLPQLYILISKETKFDGPSNNILEWGDEVCFDDILMQFQLLRACQMAGKYYELNHFLMRFRNITSCNNNGTTISTTTTNTTSNPATSLNNRHNPQLAYKQKKIFFSPSSFPLNRYLSLFYTISLSNSSLITNTKHCYEIVERTKGLNQHPSKGSQYHRINNWSKIIRVESDSTLLQMILYIRIVLNIKGISTPHIDPIVDALHSFYQSSPLPQVCTLLPFKSHGKQLNEIDSSWSLDAITTLLNYDHRPQQFSFTPLSLGDYLTPSHEPIIMPLDSKLDPKDDKTGFFLGVGNGEGSALDGGKKFDEMLSSHQQQLDKYNHFLQTNYSIDYNHIQNFWSIPILPEYILVGYDTEFPSIRPSIERLGTSPTKPTLNSASLYQIAIADYVFLVPAWVIDPNHYLKSTEQGPDPRLNKSTLALPFIDRLIIFSSILKTLFYSPRVILTGVQVKDDVELSCRSINAALSHDISTRPDHKSTSGRSKKSLFSMTIFQSQLFAPSLQGLKDSTPQSTQSHAVQEYNDVLSNGLDEFYSTINLERVLEVSPETAPFQGFQVESGRSFINVNSPLCCSPSQVRAILDLNFLTFWGLHLISHLRERRDHDTTNHLPHQDDERVDGHGALVRCPLIAAPDHLSSGKQFDKSTYNCSTSDDLGDATLLDSLLQDDPDSSSLPRLNDNLSKSLRSLSGLDKRSQTTMDSKIIQECKVKQRAMCEKVPPKELMHDVRSTNIPLKPAILNNEDNIPPHNTTIYANTITNATNGNGTNSSLHKINRSFLPKKHPSHIQTLINRFGTISPVDIQMLMGIKKEDIIFDQNYQNLQISPSSSFMSEHTGSNNSLSKESYLQKRDHSNGFKYGLARIVSLTWPHLALFKGPITCSNWDVYPLSDEKMHYAALDALVAIQIISTNYYHLIAERKILTPQYARYIALASLSPGDIFVANEQGYMNDESSEGLTYQDVILQDGEVEIIAE